MKLPLAGLPEAVLSRGIVAGVVLLITPRDYEAAQRELSGLGEKIAAVAQPIARAFDKIAGTKIAKCGGCKKMKERLNAGMSFAEALKLRIAGK